MDFDQIMRQKYVVNILGEFYVEHTQLLWGVKKK